MVRPFFKIAVISLKGSPSTKFLAVAISFDRFSADRVKVKNKSAAMMKSFVFIISSVFCFILFGYWTSIKFKKQIHINL